MLYYRGSTTIFASQHDPRFQYCLYVPPGFDEDKTGYRLIVAMHGTGRSMVQYRDAFAEFARYNRCVVPAPLFPVGPLGTVILTGLSTSSKTISTMTAYCWR